VDLDHTLLRTDTLDEAFVRALFHQPAAAAAALFALPRGRLAVKEALALAVPLDPACLLVREELLDWLRARAVEGHALYFCTAAHQSVGEAVAGHLGLFESVIGSTGHNLKGDAKAAVLTERFPDGGSMPATAAPTLRCGGGGRDRPGQRRAGDGRGSAAARPARAGRDRGRAGHTA
jgi:hypothetical protein